MLNRPFNDIYIKILSCKEQMRSTKLWFLFYFQSTLHFFSGFMLLPTGQPKSLQKYGEFLNEPIILWLGSMWVKASVLLKSRSEHIVEA